jgi:hypothetical protein
MRLPLPAVALLVPLLAPGSVGAAPSPACQEAVARGGAKFAKVVLKVSQRCALRAMNGLAASCRPEAAGGTGHAGTDAAIARATRRLGARVADACASSDLSGFARRCPDEDGPPFGLKDLVGCLRDTHLDRIGALVGVEFPALAAQPRGATSCEAPQVCQCQCASPSGAFLTPIIGDAF